MAEQDEVVIPQLPEHHGQVPSGVVTSINGSSSRLFRPLQTEEKLVLLVEATVTAEGHRVVTDGLHRTHTLRVTDLFELAGEKGARLLRDAKKSASALEDATKARAPLPGINDDEPDQDVDPDDDPDPLADIVGNS